MALGVALNQLRQQGQSNTLLSPDLQQPVVGDCPGNRDGWSPVGPGSTSTQLLEACTPWAMNWTTCIPDVHEHLWSVFRMRVALLIVVSFLRALPRATFNPQTWKEYPPLPIDLEIGGVYLPPIAQALLLALPIFLVLDWTLAPPRRAAFRLA